MDGFPIGGVLDGAGVVVLFVWLFWMLSTGRLYTKSQYDGMTADRDMWRETAQELTPVVAKVLLESETTNRLLRALPELGKESA